MVDLEVVGIRLDQISQSPILLMKESGGSRHLALWIGAAEAASIAQARDGLTPPRPLTHDLLASVLVELGHPRPELVITEVVDGVWHGEMRLAGHTVTARPSDLVAVAVRLGATVTCPEELLEESGILLDESPQDEVERFKEFLDHVSPDDFED
ncbi:hypothetical protein PACID_16640 [Acidipropionibacterium acidipropionici ATCC 4875]|uniref:BFN domain-containing protein n=1 Tax=Acidipropionibacterium acidipropionici (strain ATCC 4875 / DSM 20272 / JCM 6432 / NBRC 12425 / NCIMB 8070 / 4) TaxID=1171373 RepID=K7RWY9_ACIA4|nr:bifunctional nuclease family protein [Acidipropionibacterium acidipropionici]AFV89473.1 hypothetical protein PACID_16640 [Acidipropionibacterium acidipropionici ATCC 4875]ALN16064.1 hypothetical protein ASQ49_13215 [Acidipropionibacterium acidipropionici]APZ08185.1 hypothetical protein BWX38_01670 [Acidipropionibacterium acidipropionici]MDN6556452.1 bifunctional nuclease family protein [Acidipropionibacterium acidipropionici]